MRYLIDEYDKQGFLKPPVWLWLGWLFLAKAWVVFIVAGASREEGTKLLEIIYPIHSTFYIGLAIGFPALALIWMMGLRNQDRPRVCRFISHARWMTLLLTVMQLGLAGQQVVLLSGKFSWPLATTLVLLLWLLIYISKSRRVRDCFRSPNII